MTDISNKIITADEIYDTYISACEQYTVTAKDKLYVLSIIIGGLTLCIHTVAVEGNHCLGKVRMHKDEDFWAIIYAVYNDQFKIGFGSEVAVDDIINTTSDKVANSKQFTSISQF